LDLSWVVSIFYLEHSLVAGDFRERVSLKQASRGIFVAKRGYQLAKKKKRLILTVF